MRDTIVLGDCLEVFPTIPSDTFDYAFTSPPYNRKRNDKYQNYDDTIEDYYSFLVSFTDELLRTVKHLSFVNLQTNYYNREDVYKYIGHYADRIRNIIVWEKSNPLPASGNNVTNAIEFFIVLGDEPLRSSGTYTKNIITTSVNSRTTTKEHKAVMNSEVADWFFEKFIPDGSFVVDPFMGTGTTAVTALKHGCSYYGTELKEEYKAMADDRILDYLLS